MGNAGVIDLQMRVIDLSTLTSELTEKPSRIGGPGFTDAESIHDAVAETFDGEHPCSLCKVIQQPEAEEKKQDQQQTKPISKMDLGPIWHSGAKNLPSLAPVFSCGHSRLS